MFPISSPSSPAVVSVNVGKENVVTPGSSSSTNSITISADEAPPSPVQEITPSVIIAAPPPLQFQ